MSYSLADERIKEESSMKKQEKSIFNWLDSIKNEDTGGVQFLKWCYSARKYIIFLRKFLIVKHEFLWNIHFRKLRQQRNWKNR